VSFHEGTVTDVDFDKQLVSYQITGSQKQFEIEYDKLILSIGKSSSLPGSLRSSGNIFSLTSLHDALQIRSSMIDLFEKASSPELSEQ